MSHLSLLRLESSAQCSIKIRVLKSSYPKQVHWLYRMLVKKKKEANQWSNQCLVEAGQQRQNSTRGTHVCQPCWQDGCTAPPQCYRLLRPSWPYVCTSQSTGDSETISNSIQSQVAEIHSRNTHLDVFLVEISHRIWAAKLAVMVVEFRALDVADARAALDGASRILAAEKWNAWHKTRGNIENPAEIVIIVIGGPTIFICSRHTKFELGHFQYELADITLSKKYWYRPSEVTRYRQSDVTTW